MAKTWNSNYIRPLIFRIYNKVLERPPKEGYEGDEGVLYSSKLLSGTITVRSIVRELALGQEHLDRFIRKSTLEQGVRNCYRHILGCAPTPDDLNASVRLFEYEGIDNVIEDLFDNKGYTPKFGDDMATCLIWKHIPHAQEPPHDDIILNYTSWDGAKWTAKLDRDLFFHAPNGEWSQAHDDIILNYIDWNGTKWTVKIDSDPLTAQQPFKLAPEGDWQRFHNSTNFQYISWDGAQWQAEVSASNTSQ